MKKVLIAGATGYLGRYAVKSLKQSGYHVKVLVRSQEKMKHEGPYFSPAIAGFVDEVVIGDVSKPETIQDICSDVDYVFSSIGITSQKSDLSFMDVDYQGNLNLLTEAEQSGVKRFMYINVHGVEDCPSALIVAKQKFVLALTKSTVPHVIINPTGYYSDMTEFYRMAQKGRVYLFGNGENRMNPIHGVDLADFCASAFSRKGNLYPVGGSRVYTYREMAELAIKVANPDAKITQVPLWLIRISFPLLKRINRRQYELLQFFFYVMTHDVVADTYGNIELESYFESIGGQKE